MSRLAAIDRALVLILVPAWAIILVLGVISIFQGGGVAVLKVLVEDADSHPILTARYSP